MKSLILKVFSLLLCVILFSGVVYASEKHLVTATRNPTMAWFKTSDGWEFALAKTSTKLVGDKVEALNDPDVRLVQGFFCFPEANHVKFKRPILVITANTTVEAKVGEETFISSYLLLLDPEGNPLLSNDEKHSSLRPNMTNPIPTIKCYVAFPRELNPTKVTTVSVSGVGIDPGE